MGSEYTVLHIRSLESEATHNTNNIALNKKSILILWKTGFSVPVNFSNVGTQFCTHVPVNVPHIFRKRHFMHVKKGTTRNNTKSEVAYVIVHYHTVTRAYLPFAPYNDTF